MANFGPKNGQTWFCPKIIPDTGGRFTGHIWAAPPPPHPRPNCIFAGPWSRCMSASGTQHSASSAHPTVRIPVPALPPNCQAWRLPIDGPEQKKTRVRTAHGTDDPWQALTAMAVDGILAGAFRSSCPARRTGGALRGPSEVSRSPMAREPIRTQEGAWLGPDPPPPPPSRGCVRDQGPGSGGDHA